MDDIAAEDSIKKDPRDIFSLVTCIVANAKENDQIKNNKTSKNARNFETLTKLKEKCNQFDQMVFNRHYGFPFPTTHNNLFVAVPFEYVPPVVYV